MLSESSAAAFLPVVPALEKYARAAFKDGINSDRRYYNTTHYFFQQHFSSRRESRHRRSRALHET